MSITGAMQEIEEAIYRLGRPCEEHLVRQALYNAKNELAATPIIEIAVEARKCAP